MQRQKGQSLVTVMIVVIVALTLTAGAIALTVTNSQTASGFDRGSSAYSTAESGAENAVIRLLRDPTYTGETIAIGQGTAESSVSGSNPYTIIVTGRYSGYVKKIQVVVDYTGGVVTVLSWKEIY